MVNSPHGKGVTFTIRSAPVGYAAEYLACGSFAAIPMGRFPLMSIYCILYHFWDVRRILLPPPRQIRRDPASFYQPTTQSPPFHQPRHTLQTHSSQPPAPPAIPSFPPPSRRTQQIQGFQRSGADVCLRINTVAQMPLPRRQAP